MARLISNNGREFEFECEGRTYLVALGRKLAGRNPSARRNGHLVIVRDDGSGKPMAKWGTKPKQWIELVSLARDYDLSSFIVVGQPKGEWQSRGPSQATGTPAYMAPEQTPPPSHAPVTDAALMLFRDTKIGMRGEPGAEQLCLTDMWKANGSDPSKRPSKWLAQDGTIAFLGYLQEDLQKDTLVEPEPGNPRTGDGGSTWAYWQLAFAYAKYLSPAFHAWVNQAAREKIMGERPIALTTRLDPAVSELLSGQNRILEQLAGASVQVRTDLGAVSERVAAVEAKLERLECEDLPSRAVDRPETPKDISRVPMRQVLESAGLPLNKNSMGRFVFARVAFEALSLVGHADLAWPVPRVMVDKAAPFFDRALQQLRRDGFEVRNRWLVYVGSGKQCTESTLVRHMVMAMRATSTEGTQGALFG